MNIYFIGMPGSGKSTIAKAVSKKINHTFIDLDAEIEQDALMYIDDIFEKHGEKTFRKLETESLMKVKGCDRAVVSCGGGIVTSKANKDLMDGFTIYLDTDLDILKKRLEQDYQRPLLKQVSLEHLYETRWLKYQDFADAIVDNSQSVDETVDTIITLLKEKKII